MLGWLLTLAVATMTVAVPLDCGAGGDVCPTNPPPHTKLPLELLTQVDIPLTDWPCTLATILNVSPFLSWRDPASGAVEVGAERTFNTAEATMTVSSDTAGDGIDGCGVGVFGLPVSSLALLISQATLIVPGH